MWQRCCRGLWGGYYLPRNLGCIADRTTNIVERVIFLVTGGVVELSP